MPQTRRQAATRLAAHCTAADALVANDDCWTCICINVLQSHDLAAYAAWRLSSQGCLRLWKRYFEDVAPWRVVLPDNVEVALAAGVKLGGAARRSTDPSPPAEWLRVMQRLAARRREAASLMRRPAQPVAPAPPTARFELADFTLHVAVRRGNRAPRLIFVGAASLDQGFGHLEQPGTHSFRGFGADDLLEPTLCGTGTKLLAQQDDDIFEYYGRSEVFAGPDGIKVEAYLTRSDGATACLVQNKQMDRGNNPMDKGWTSPEFGFDDRNHSTLGGRCHFRLLLDEYFGFGPLHRQWDEALRGKYDEIQDDAKRSLRTELETPGHYCERFYDEFRQPLNQKMKKKTIDEMVDECTVDVVALKPFRAVFAWEATTEDESEPIETPGVVCLLQGLPWHVPGESSSTPNRATRRST